MTKLTYAEAVKRAELWEHGRLRPTGEDTEALAVLRRAGKVMEAVEQTDIFQYHDDDTDCPIIRACAGYRKGE